MMTAKIMNAKSARNEKLKKSAHKPTPNT